MWDINIAGNGIGPLGVAALSFQIFLNYVIIK